MKLRISIVKKKLLVRQ